MRPLIESEWGWEICGEARDGREAVALAEQLKPDVVVLDVAMPELNGVEVTRQIKRPLPDTEVLAFTGTESEALVHQLFAAGARGCVLKATRRAHLIRDQGALRTPAVFSARACPSSFSSYLKGGVDAGQIAPGGLTPREREVVQLLAEGKSNKEVATAARHQREDGGDPSRRDHAQARLQRLQRAGPLRGAQSHRAAVAARRGAFASQSMGEIRGRIRVSMSGPRTPAQTRLPCPRSNEHPQATYSRQLPPIVPNICGVAGVLLARSSSVGAIVRSVPVADRHQSVVGERVPLSGQRERLFRGGRYQRAAGRVSGTERLPGRLRGQSGGREQLPQPDRGRYSGAGELPRSPEWP